MSIKSKQVALAGYLFDLVVDVEEGHTAVFVEKVKAVPHEKTAGQLSLFGPLPTVREES